MRGHGEGSQRGSTRVCSPALGAIGAVRGQGTAVEVEGLRAVLRPRDRRTPGFHLKAPQRTAVPQLSGAHRHRAAPAPRPVGTRSRSFPFLRPFLAAPGPAGKSVRHAAPIAEREGTARHCIAAASPRFLREDTEPPPNRRQQCSKRKEKGQKKTQQNTTSLHSSG